MQEGLTRFPSEHRPSATVSAARIGVLALQGDTREHLAALRECGADAVPRAARGELDAVDGLVIPGGESTTMSHLLRELDLLEPLRARLADGLPAYGACAGMILLASEILDAGATGPRGGSAGWHRYHRAAQRFWASGRLVRRRCQRSAASTSRCTGCSFARRGWSGSVTGVQVLARAAGHAVAVRQGPVLATAFHPEMTGDRRIHRLFVDIVNGRR